MTFSPEHIILDSVRDTFTTRDDVAMCYALALRTNAVTDWPKVNAAIIERWSPSALEYIKQKAWKRNDLIQEGATGDFFLVSAEVSNQDA